jgi:hypothetical protein
MRVLAVIIGFLLLSGCVEDNQTSIVQCKREMAREIDKFDPKTGLNEMHAGVLPTSMFGKDAVYMLTCMRGAGYRHNVSPKQCDPADGDLFKNPYCYEPVDFLGNIGFKLQLATIKR